jgi:hypothetical protein
LREKPEITDRWPKPLVFFAEGQGEKETTMSTEQETARDTWKYAEKSLTWYGWGSPVGLGLFVMSIGVFILLLHEAGIVR